MLKFSIIIPIYNRATFIKKTLNSVLNQTYKNIEIICVNDFSTDKSLEILNEFAQKDSRIKIVSHEKNLGTHMARKNGVQNATGDYILFLDCDDELLPNACEILVEKLKIKNVDIIEFGYLYKQETTLPNKNITIDKFFTSLIYPKQRPGTIWNKVYKTNLLKFAFSKMTDFYSIMGQDAYESAVIAYYTSSYEQCDKVLYRYMYNESQSVSFKKKNVLQAEKYLLSLQADVKAFKIFFETHAPEHKNGIYDIETFYFEYFYDYQLFDTVKFFDRKKVLKLLPKYFSQEVIATHSKKLNTPIIFVGLKHKILILIKKIIPKSIKNKIKDLIKKSK